MQERLSFIGQHKLIGIIRADSVEQALMAARAGHRGGLRLIEVTFSVPDAAKAISLVRDELPDCLIGAGTVLDVEQARLAADAGAQFVVAPDTNPEVVNLCKERGVLACPGAATPTEIRGALRLGADLVKVFPAGLLGGPAYLRALRQPLPEVRLVPTGGVSAENAADYLAAGAFAVAMGANIFSREAIAAGDVGTIERAARESVAGVRASG